MGAGRPTKQRQKEICKALEDAYNILKDINPTYQEITDKANEFETIRNSKDGKIGDSTLEQSKAKNINTLYEKIKNDKDNFIILKALAPTELSKKIDQLHSSLGENALLASQIENLENRLKNKENIISNKDKRITEYQEEIKRLRGELTDMEKANE